MNKQEFLKELEKEIKIKKKKDYKSYLSYYDELIEDYKEDGNSEVEAVNKIGNPKDIAKNNIDSLENSSITNSMSTTLKVIIVILLILGSPLWGSLVLCLLCLIVCAFILIGCAYLLIWCIPFMIGTFGGASFLGGIITVVLSVFCIQDGIHLFLFQLGGGLLMAGIGTMITMFTIWIGKKFFDVTKKFTDKIMHLFNRKGGINEV